MQKRIIIEKIAQKIGWKKSQARTAVKELSESGTLFDYKKILSICLQYNEPDLRVRVATKDIRTSYKGDFIDLLVHLFNIDPCINPIALFNIFDLKRKNYSYSFVEYDHNDIHIEDRPKNFDFTLAHQLFWDKANDHFIFPNLLTYEIISRLLFDEVDIMNKEALTNVFLRLSDRVGFPVFNIPIFLSLGNELWYSPDREKYFGHLFKSLNTSFVSGIRANKRKYWFIFMLVEVLKARGLSQKEAIKEVSSYIKETYASTRRRYFDKKRELNDSSLSFNDIINQYQLRPLIFQYLNQSLLQVNGLETDK